MPGERADERADLVERLRARVDDDRALGAIERVPRHAFVPAAQRAAAYEDRPLPIGDGETISAPHMVAIMLADLDLSAGDRVLEIGTGCGYHAAATAELVGPENVYSVEYHADLAERARETLAATGYGAISVRHGDGHDGWAAHAPYDPAYLTCAADAIPDAVRKQVREGGIVLAPIGRGVQRLIRAEKTSEGWTESDRGGVRFVEMHG
ncbi:protein-L-isoaspartate(D-aspartate) O-methyltransferase [Halococcoides cellulosivorans]|uniref:Protein-L-isoaspartate O-methyltransferase n=1 Tax=Halococcoides cellulosivorans TaxID=1679096 RepID=A0A2R4X0P4_9EURY|nr:protein-L-isoaspartate(D-aspartate) O-methyltransferase [Halococcoides cellulosivorans]AWB27367.1 protein-L-isoaspartate O-methyltransferase [Halococcoides cellulosivorans]